jgi:hypothetical protein
LDFGGSWTRALNLDGVIVRGCLFFDEGFHCEGGIRLLTAQIGNNLECNGGTFVNLKPGGHALWADRIKIAGSAFLGHLEKPGSPVDGAVFTADGTVKLVGAQIGNVLSCSGAKLHEPAPQRPSDPIQALNCDRIKALTILLDKGFSAQGEVRLQGAEIGINLICSGGRFTNDIDKDAISADGSKIGGALHLDEGFAAQGEVALINCQIGGDVICKAGSFTKVNLTRATINGALIWSEVSNAATAQLNLTNATTGPLEDQDGNASWPAPGKLYLDGFAYTRISQSAQRSVSERLDWLSRVPQFSTQPYQQLAKVMRECGDIDGSHQVILTMERKRRQVPGTRWIQRVKGWILQWTIGYGQRPLWAMGWLVVLFAVGAIVFGLGYLGGGITPRDKDAYEEFAKRGYPPSYCSQFNPLLYSFEHSFPLVSLGVKDRWGPNAKASTMPPVVNLTALRYLQDHKLAISSSGWLLCWMWVQTVLGWAFATLFVVGLTGIVKSD